MLKFSPLTAYVAIRRLAVTLACPFNIKSIVVTKFAHTPFTISLSKSLFVPAAVIAGVLAATTYLISLQAFLIKLLTKFISIYF